MPTSILKKTTADDNVSNASEHNHRNSIISTSPTLAEEPNHDTDEHSPSPSSRSNTTTYPSQATTQLHAESHPSDPPPRSIYTRIFKAIAPDLPVSIVLENAGSVARDHLANERTWLAYVRTSLAIAGTGVALVQLFEINISRATASTTSPDQRISLQRFARPLGATTVILGFLILWIGVYRYFTIQTALTQKLFPVAQKTVILISTVLAALAAVIFSMLIAFPTKGNDNT